MWPIFLSRLGSVLDGTLSTDWEVGKLELHLATSKPRVWLYQVSPGLQYVLAGNTSVILRCIMPMATNSCMYVVWNRIEQVSR